MSCLTGLHLQIITFVSVPHEILLLQHKVLREYARLAVGPDFIHALPSALILTAVAIVLWRTPLSSAWISEMVGSPLVYKALQVAASWVTLNSTLWFWLILQRLLYCYVWTYWSYESEYRDITYEWWQRVWSLYYPPPLQPPAMSASFISWLISMTLAVTALGCALSVTRVQSLAEESLSKLQSAIAISKSFANLQLQRMQEALLTCEKDVQADEDKLPRSCDDCQSEVSTEANQEPRREVRPVSYGTNWVPKPSFPESRDAQKKGSLKSLQTVAVVNEVHDPDKITPSLVRQRRGCHTVIPSNSSDKSSEC